LRPFEKFDAHTIQSQGSDPSVAHWMISFPVPWPRWLARHRIMQARQDMARSEGFHFAIIAEDLPGRPMVGACSAAFIGDPSRPPELAYWIAPDYQRQGRAKQALTILLAFLFQRDDHLRAIEAAVIEGNEPSTQLLLSLGFRYHEDERASAPLSWNRPRDEQVLLHRHRLWRTDWLSGEWAHINIEPSL
jgi:RimJ/RimL family protein N-acetyltransferase